MKNTSTKTDSSAADIAPYRHCRRSVVIRVNDEKWEIYCEEEGDLNYKPACYRFAPCKCGAMDVVVSWQKDEEMRCAKCGLPRGCPNCAGGPEHWRLYPFKIECFSCGCSYQRQDPPSKTKSTTRQG